MAHYAKVQDGTVTQVIVADEEFFKTYVDSTPGKWIQTSYNTNGGKHYEPNSSKEDSKPPLRKNYAGIGDVYDESRDAFYRPQPYPSWTLDEDTCWWVAPVAKPSDDKIYEWDEDSKAWKEITGPTT
tara:strand:- start:43 stop:423 length:381 start_codon:yes stop_codon:yes gene_type:complete